MRLDRRCMHASKPLPLSFCRVQESGTIFRAVLRAVQRFLISAPYTDEKLLTNIYTNVREALNSNKYNFNAETQLS